VYAASVYLVLIFRVAAHELVSKRFAHSSGIDYCLADACIYFWIILMLLLTFISLSTIRTFPHTFLVNESPRLLCDNQKAVTVRSSLPLLAIWILKGEGCGTSTLVQLNRSSQGHPSSQPWTRQHKAID